MFIVPAPKNNHPKPQRGGMELPRAAHAAPPGLDRNYGTRRYYRHAAPQGLGASGALALTDPTSILQTMLRSGAGSRFDVPGALCMGATARL